MLPLAIEFSLSAKKFNRQRLDLTLDQILACDRYRSSSFDLMEAAALSSI